MSKSLYKPKHLEKLSHEIKEKIEKKKQIGRASCRERVSRTV